MPLRLLLLLLFLPASSNAVATEPGALRLRVWIRKKTSQHPGFRGLFGQVLGLVRLVQDGSLCRHAHGQLPAGSLRYNARNPNL